MGSVAKGCLARGQGPPLWGQPSEKPESLKGSGNLALVLRHVRPLSGHGPVGGRLGR